MSHSRWKLLHFLKTFLLSIFGEWWHKCRAVNDMYIYVKLCNYLWRGFWQGIGRTQSMNESSRTSSYFMSGSGNSITFQNGPWTWTFGQNNKFMFKFMLSPINQQKSYHFHKKIGIWGGHFTRCCITPVNKTVCAAKCGQYARNIKADIKLGNFNFNFKTNYYMPWTGVGAGT